MPDTVYQNLDARVVKLWRIGQAIRSAVWLGILLIVGLLLALGEVWRFPTFAMVFAGAALLRLALFLWYPARAYAAWGYRLDGKVLETRHGIWWRTVELLPLSRLQHVDLTCGPIERSLGLATLMFHTAGTHQAMVVIPGLDASEAARLRDQLVAVGGDDGL